MSAAPRPLPEHESFCHAAIPHTGKWLNPHGRYVPAGNVSFYDQRKEAMLAPLLAEAKRLNAELEAFKVAAFEAWHSFGDEALEDYGVETNTEKGNGTLYTFDQRHKAQMCSSAVLEFDLRIQGAASLIKECLDDWGKDADPNLMAVVNGAFETDGKGNINVRKVLALARLRIDDERWQTAMAAVQDAMLEVCRSSYLNFYERVDTGGGKTAWKAIPLSLAKV